MNLPTIRTLPHVRPGSRSGGLELSATVLAGAALGTLAAASANPLVGVGAVAMVGLAAFGAVRPAMFLLVFLLTRPVLDSFTDHHFDMGFASINAAGAGAALLIGLFLLLLGAAREVIWPRASLAMFLVVGVSAGAFLEAKLSWLAPFMHSVPLAAFTRVIGMLALYLLAANLVTNARQARTLFAVVAVAALVPAFVGLLQLAHVLPTACQVCEESSQALGLSRVNGTFVGPNPFGDYLAAVILMVVALPATIRVSSRTRLAILALLTVALVATYSREAWAMALIGVVILEWRRRKQVIIGVAVTVVVLIFAIPSVHDRVLPSKDATAIVARQDVGSYSSYTWRLNTWKTVFEKFKHKPLTGYGLGTAAYDLPPLGSPEGTKGYEPHNLVLTVLLEGGIVLMAAYAVLFAVVLRRFRRLARTNWELREHARFVWVFWILILIVGLTAGNTLSETAMMSALFALSGAVEGVYARRGPALAPGARARDRGSPPRPKPADRRSREPAAA